MTVEFEKVIAAYLQASVNSNTPKERIELQRAILNDFFNYSKGADYEIIVIDKRSNN